MSTAKMVAMPKTRDVSSSASPSYSIANHFHFDSNLLLSDRSCTVHTRLIPRLSSPTPSARAV